MWQGVLRVPPPRCSGRSTTGSCPRRSAHPWKAALAVIKPERRPVRALGQSPADMRHRIGVRVVEAVHVALEVLGLEATFDLADPAALDGQADRLAGVALERQQDVAGVDDDGALARALIRPGGDEAARPMVPAAGLVDEACCFSTGYWPMAQRKSVPALEVTVSVFAVARRAAALVARRASSSVGFMRSITSGGSQASSIRAPVFRISSCSGENSSSMVSMTRSECFIASSAARFALQRGVADIAGLVARERHVAVQRRQMQDGEHAAELRPRCARSRRAAGCCRR